MDRLAVVVGVVILLVLIALIIKSLRSDDQIGAAAPQKPPRKEPAVTRRPSPVVEPSQAGMPAAQEDGPAPELRVNSTDAPPMARRVPRADRSATPAGESLAAPATPTVAPPHQPAPPAVAAPPSADSAAETLPARRESDPLPVRRQSQAAPEMPRRQPAPRPAVPAPDEFKREVIRDPEAIRRSMSGLQAGIARGRKVASTEPTPPGPDQAAE